jgi:hypothetical protein
MLHLLVELIHEGKAETIPELVQFEPIETATLVSILSSRTGKNFGPDVDAWCRWFTDECQTATAHEKETLTVVKNLADTTRYYVQRITKGRGQAR